MKFLVFLKNLSMDFIENLLWNWRPVLCIVAAIAGFIYLSNLDCEWQHPASTPREDIVRCAPASDIGQCLKYLGHSGSKYQCK